MEAIGHVRHKNLVRLLGYCIEGIHRQDLFSVQLMRVSRIRFMPYVPSAELATCSRAYSMRFQFDGLLIVQNARV